MRQFTAFTKKEFLQQLRSGKLWIVGILFTVLGIMNPAVAKLTPQLLKLMSQDLENSGFIVGEVSVDALTSWTQFYKNIPIGLIVFLLMFSGHLSEEFYNKTLINVLTKGLKRHNIMISKIAVSTLLWSAGYFLSFGITYGYNAYFWDNGTAHNLMFSVFAFYLMGVWLVSTLYLASGFFASSASTAITAGTFFLCSYLLGMIAKLKKYVPTHLMDAGGLLLKETGAGEYLPAVALTAALILLNWVLAVLMFNRRQV